MTSQQQGTRKVPMTRSDNSLIEQEFDSIREKFEVEMNKMEEEMARFRSQLIESEKNRLASSFINSTSSMSASTTSTSTSSRSLTNAHGKQQTSSARIQQKGQLQNESVAPHSDRRTASSSVESRSATSRMRSTMETGGSHISDQTGFRIANQSYDPSWINEMDSPLIKDSIGGKFLKLRFDVAQYEPEQILVKTEGNRLQVQARREDTSTNQSMYREYNREFLLPGGVNPETIRSTLSADGILTVEAPLFNKQS